MTLGPLTRLRLPAATVEKLQVPVTADRGATDPTTFTVEMAVVDDDVVPSGGQWVAATWNSLDGTPKIERTVTGSAGTFAVWVRISGGGEVVVRKVGIVEFVANP